MVGGIAIKLSRARLGASFLGSSLLGLAAVFLGTPAQARDLRSSDVFAADTPTVQAMQVMGSLLDARTQGRYRLASPGAADRSSENFTVGQVRTGTLDMARVALEIFNASVPATAVLSAPYLFRSAAHQKRVLDGPLGARILNDLTQQGVVGLCFYDLGGRSIYSVAKPIRALSDLNGLTVRVQPGYLLSGWLQKIGATPAPMPFDQVGHALRAHAIDAAIGNWLSFISGKAYEAAKFYSPMGYAAPPGVVVVSKQLWDTLSASDREVFAASAKASVVHLRDRLDAYEAEARKTAERAGVTVVADVQAGPTDAELGDLYRELFPQPQQQQLLKLILAEASDR
jgi:TRAP-type C4-dicarboxylate transport system substrate-binding protein